MSRYYDIVESQKKGSSKVNDEIAFNLVYHAHACHHAGNWTKAKDVYQEILEFRINAYGQQHEKSITAMEWLAQNSRKARLFAMGAAQFQQILAALAYTLAPDPSHYALVYFAFLIHYIRLIMFRRAVEINWFSNSI